MRNHVKELLKSINAPAELIVPQALKDVASSDREVRHAAVNWLGETPLIEKSQADVARALEPLLSNADGRDAVVKALETWATKDNVPALAGLLSQNVSRQPILRILTKLKDERAADAIAARLPDGGDRPVAAAALKDIGPPAEKAVLAYFHHPDRAVQKVAADLLKGFGTTQDALLEQTLKDVSDAKKGRRRDALEWLATADLVDSKRNDVSKAVEPVLQDQDRGMRDVAYRAYFRWLGPEGLNTLIQIVIAEQSDHRHKAMEALSKYKDLKAAGAIASRLPHGGDRSVASKCLKAMCGWAETPCVQLLGSKDRAVRFEVVHILQVVGTRQCIVYLQGSAKVHAKDQEYLRTVGAAVQAISAR